MLGVKISTCVGDSLTMWAVFKMPHSKGNPGWHLFQLSAEVGTHPAGAPPGD